MNWRELMPRGFQPDPLIDKIDNIDKKAGEEGEQGDIVDYVDIVYKAPGLKTESCPAPALGAPAKLLSPAEAENLVEHFGERAAIAEHDGELPRQQIRAHKPELLAALTAQTVQAARSAHAPMSTIPPHVACSTCAHLDGERCIVRGYHPILPHIPMRLCGAFKARPTVLEGELLPREETTDEAMDRVIATAKALKDREGADHD